MTKKRQINFNPGDTGAPDPLGTKNKPEKKHFDLLHKAFLLAGKISLTAAGRRLGLCLDDFFELIRVKESMDGPGYAKVNNCGFEGWPKTPGITFSIFARNCARELAAAYVAKVAELLHAADCDSVLFRLEDQKEVTQKELDDWLAAVFLKLRKAFDLTQPLEFARDFDSLSLRLEAEAEAYFEAKIIEPDYIAIDCAKRTITIGVDIYTITSEDDWDFVRLLISNQKLDKITARYEGAIDYKNRVDTLRNKLTKEGLHQILVFLDGGYGLNGRVKILNHSQAAIRGRKKHHTAT